MKQNNIFKGENFWYSDS